MACSDNRPRSGGGERRAVGGGGGGIGFPAAGAAEGEVRTVNMAGAWCCRAAGAGVGRFCGAVGKGTETAGAAERVAARAGGGCREPAPKVEVIRW